VATTNVVHHVWTTKYGTTSKDDADDFLGLLVEWRWLRARVKQRDEVGLQRLCWLFDRDISVWSISARHLDDNLRDGFRAQVSVADMARPPRTSGRGSPTTDVCEALVHC
jgi:hypothetical protein